MEPMTDERLEKIRKCAAHVFEIELLSEVDRLRENLRSGRCNGCFVGKELAGWRALAEERGEAARNAIAALKYALDGTPEQALERRNGK